MQRSIIVVGASLVGLFGYASTVPAAKAPKTQPTTRTAASTRPTTKPGAVSSDAMMNQMLRPPAAAPVTPLQPIPDTPTVDKTSSNAVKPDAPAVATMREGTFIVDRLGRLTRSADGSQAEFSFEADGKALRDPPVIILPNLKLMMMENAVTGASRDLRFRVTGMVTEYRGRNYVLLEKVFVVPDAAQQF